MKTLASGYSCQSATLQDCISCISGRSLVQLATAIWPHLQKLRDGYAARGLAVLGVHRPMNEADLDIERVRAVAVELGVTESCALDNDHSIGDAMGVIGWPTYFLFDADRKLRRRAMGNFGVKIIGAALERMFNEELETGV